MQSLAAEKIKASFFLTGRFYRNLHFNNIIKRLKLAGHYLGAHSDQHLLYCDWTKRDSLLVNEEQFTTDLLNNYRAIEDLGIKKNAANFFLPPYEWYNDSIAAWTNNLGLQLINYTPGTRSHADYTFPSSQNNYRSTSEIYKSILDFEQSSSSGLNGFILLLHIGTDEKRTDKFYYKLPALIHYLKLKGYNFLTIDELLN